MSARANGGTGVAIDDLDLVLAPSGFRGSVPQVHADAACSRCSRSTYAAWIGGHGYRQFAVDDPWSPRRPRICSLQISGRHRGRNLNDLPRCRRCRPPGRSTVPAGRVAPAHARQRHPCRDAASHEHRERIAQTARPAATKFFEQFPDVGTVHGRRRGLFFGRPRRAGRCVGEAPCRAARAPFARVRPCRATDPVPMRRSGRRQRRGRACAARAVPAVREAGRGVHIRRTSSLARRNCSKATRMSRTSRPTQCFDSLYWCGEQVHGVLNVVGSPDFSVRLNHRRVPPMDCSDRCAMTRFPF